MKSNVVVITTECSLLDLGLPLPRSEIEHVLDTDGCFTVEQERTLVRWAMSSGVSVCGHSFPINEERRKTLDAGGRTSKTEDIKIARWVLLVGDAIDAWRQYA